MRRRVEIAVIGRTPLGGGSSSRRQWREAIRDAALSIAPDPRVLPVGASLTVEVMFRISELRFASSDLDNLVKPVLDTLFRSRDEQLDPSLTAALLPVDDAAIHRLVVEKHRADGTEGEGVSVSVSWEDDLTDPGAPADP
jgi:Holliday junction resolvase RusA-like endonuclease